MAAAKVAVPPSEVTDLRATNVTARSVALAWKPPATGTHPIRYTVLYRVHGTSAWNVGATASDTSVVVSPLKPATEYEFEVTAHNN